MHQKTLWKLESYPNKPHENPVWAAQGQKKYQYTRVKVIEDETDTKSHMQSDVATAPKPNKRAKTGTETNENGEVEVNYKVVIKNSVLFHFFFHDDCMFFKSHLHINTSRFFWEGGGSVRYCLYIAKKILSKSIIEIFSYEKKTYPWKQKYMKIKNNTYVYFLKRHIFLVCCMFFST